MKLIPLGTNGFFPSFGRQTACYAIPYGKILILLDAGSGLFRFAETAGKKLLKGIGEVHIFLSHYHLDHTFGFYAAFKLFENTKVKVFAQSKRQVFWEFVSLKHFPVDYSKIHQNFQWAELKVGINHISDYQVLVRKQYHRGEGSLALRFKFYKREVAYVTDSEPTKESIKFVKDVPLLLHEWEFTDNKSLKKGKIRLEEQFHDGHVTTVGAALIAKKARVGKLVLIHHYPFANKKQLKEQLKLARSIFPRTELARDLKEVDLFYGSVERF